MQIEHKISLQMEHSAQVPPQLMISRVSPDMIHGQVIWNDTNAMKSYAQLGCIRLQTGTINLASTLPDVISTSVLTLPLTNIRAGDGLS